MSNLDFIVPVKNQKDDIERVVDSIEKSASELPIEYKVIFVDDFSSDQTSEEIKKYINNSGNVIYDANGDYSTSKYIYHHKKGKKGDEYSILEGSRISRAEHIALVDDFESLSPEKLLLLFNLAKTKGHAVLNGVSNGKHKNGSNGNGRRLILKGNREIKANGQNGNGTKLYTRIFKKEIIDSFDEGEVEKEKFEKLLEGRTKHLGYEVIKEPNGESKKILDVIKLKVKNGRSEAIKERIKSSSEMFSKEIFFKGKKFVTGNDLHLKKNALITFAGWQKVALFTFPPLVILGLVVNFKFTLMLAFAALTALYFADIIFSFFTLISNLKKTDEIKFSAKELKDIDERKLPVYSILCPLYKEANVVKRFTRNISKLDWPKDKLDIILILEEDDKETIKAAKNLKLPAYFRIMVVPNSSPKTKPKACNYGLAYAKGEYVVIYDAEDRPEETQLKKAYLGFKKVKPNVVCLQSKLNYYNSNQNLLTRLFTAEYSLWFDLILPGLQLIDTTIPLGGTSNHFKINAIRYLGAWDPFNVTEDCDLGVRLFKAGFKTEIMDSTTFEEANSRILSWINQRSRWIKGYLQTYLVHMRNPLEFLKRNGRHLFIFHLVIGMRMIFMVVNPILWFMTLAYFIFNSYVGEFIESLYPPIIFYMGSTALVFGNFMYFYFYMIGCAKRGRWDLVKYIFFIPFYWILASVASIKAFYQLLAKPYYWEKTMHGMHLSRKRNLLNINVSLDIVTGININKIKNYTDILSSPFSSFSRFILEIVDLFGPQPFKDKSDDILSPKVLIFNWKDIKNKWAGGAEVYIHQIAKRWVNKGYDVTLFCSWDGISKRNEKIEGVNIVRRGGFFSSFVFAFFYYLMHLRGKFDVIVDCENGIPFYTPLYSFLPRILLVHHVHKNHFSQKFAPVISHFAQFLETKLMPFVYKKDQVITVSESSKLDLIALGFDTESIEVVNPGVENLDFSPPKKTEYPSIIYLGRLKPWKSIDTAIIAVKKLVNKYPNLKFKIAGFGESRSHLENLVKRLGIEKNIVFMGFVSEKEKQKLMSEAWAFVYPSKIEGWGITAIEANACGTPVVASDVKGLKDAISPFRSGLLFQYGNALDLAEKIDLIFKDSKLRNYLSKESKEWSRKFTWEGCSIRILGLIESRISLKNPELASGYVEERLDEV